MSKNKTLKKALNKTLLTAAINILDVSAGLLASPKKELCEKVKIIEVVKTIKTEMEIEWNKTNPEAKLLRNFIRGRITTCEDILLRLK